MKVLVCHNEYTLRGGEERVVDTELSLLRAAGCEAASLRVKTEEFLEMPTLMKLGAIARLAHPSMEDARMRARLNAERPDVVHFHNLIPSLSAAAVREAADFGCATVRTLHNYRLTCMAGTHYRSGSVCEACDGAKRLPGIVSGCYRNSRAQSFVVARAVSAEWRLALRYGIPDVFVCLSDFGRSRFIAAGLPPERLVVKPNSVDYGIPLPWRERDGACFVGRLSPEKGVVQLIHSWPRDGVRLTVVGDGPLSDQVDAGVSCTPCVRSVGPRDGSWVRQCMRASRVLVLPSLSFEGLPTVALEAFSEGTPVVAFDHGWFSEFREVLGVPRVVPGDFSGLVSLAVEIAEMPERRWQDLSQRALALHAQRFTHDQNIRALLNIYERALNLRKKRVESI